VNNSAAASVRMEDCGTGQLGTGINFALESGGATLNWPTAGEFSAKCLVLNAPLNHYYSHYTDIGKNMKLNNVTNLQGSISRWKSITLQS
jgi:hypothetical protein